MNENNDLVFFHIQYKVQRTIFWIRDEIFCGEWKTNKQTNRMVSQFVFLFTQPTIDINWLFYWSSIILNMNFITNNNFVRGWRLPWYSFNILPSANSDIATANGKVLPIEGPSYPSPPQWKLRMQYYTNITKNRNRTH